jgi:hypothetical protein
LKLFDVVHGPYAEAKFHSAGCFPNSFEVLFPFGLQSVSYGAFGLVPYSNGCWEHHHWITLAGPELRWQEVGF